MDLNPNIGLDLVRATEAAALSAGRWMGLGKPEEADLAAFQAMYETLNTIHMNGMLVIGEEKPGHHPLLVSGQKVGQGSGAAVDVVCDAIDGRHQLAQGYPGALAAVAVAPAGAMWRPAPAVYMDKIVVNAEVAPALVPDCLTAPAAWTLDLVARVKGKQISDLTAFVLDRPRHAPLIAEIRAAGARVMLRPDGDISEALLACSLDGKVDILMGVGGIPEGLIVACAVKALNGAMLGKLDPQSVEERRAIQETGIDLRRVLTADDLVASNDVFFAATGITDGPLLEGVQYSAKSARSNSLVLRGETKTRRAITAEHLLRN